jgi:hypothetical protein
VADNRKEYLKMPFTCLSPMIGASLACFLMCAPLHGQCKFRSETRVLPAGVKLTIRAEKPVAETQKPFIIRIELSNESTKSVSMRDDLAAELNYIFLLNDSRANEPPLTASERHLRAPMPRSGNDITLAPGEKLTDKEDLSTIYDVSVIGTYTVQACREVYGWGSIYSNKLIIPFIEPPAALKEKNSEEKKQ